MALTTLQTTIGAKGITYTERVKGKTISFHPRGIVLPRICPRAASPSRPISASRTPPTPTQRPSCPARAALDMLMFRALPLARTGR